MEIHRHMIKSYRVRFFRVAVYDDQGQRIAPSVAGRKVANALTREIPLPQLNLVPDYDHQAREVSAANRGRLEGCFAKLRSDAPHVVRGNTGQEQQIRLLPGDKIVDKSYFIFFPSVSLLVFQMNRDGGTATRFFDYLNRLMPPRHMAVREDIIRPEAMDQLDDHEIKWFEVAFVRPRNVANANPNDWTSNTIGGLGGVNVGRVRLKVSAPRGGSLGGRAANFLQGFFRQGEPAGLRVKLEDIESPIDLLAEVVQGNIQVQLHDGYPHPAAILQGMMEIYNEQRDRLQAAIGDAERIP